MQNLCPNGTVESTNTDKSYIKVGGDVPELERLVASLGQALTNLQRGPPPDLETVSSDLKRDCGWDDVPGDELNGEDEPCEGPNIITFVVGKERRRLLAHKEIVAARCKYVEASVEWKQDVKHSVREHPIVIPLPELTPIGVWACLEYIYTGGFRFKSEKVWEVFQAGMFLNINPLTDICAKFILENVTDKNTWDMLESGLLLGAGKLTAAAVDRIAQRTRIILGVTDLSQPFVTAGALLKMVQRDNLTIYEKDLARMVLSGWVANTKEPKEAVDEVLRHICWPQVYEEDMDLLCQAMKKQRLPHDVMAEVLKWVGGPPKADDIPKAMRTRYRDWAFLLRNPKYPPSKYKDIGPPKLTGSATWIEMPKLPLPFGCHVECMSNVIVQDTYGRLNATKTFTVEAWVKFDEDWNVGGDVGQCSVVSKHGPSSGWEIRANNECVEFMITLRDRQVKGGGGNVWHEVVRVPRKNTRSDGSSTCSADLSDVEDEEGYGGGWFHIVGTFDGKCAMVYVDGSCEGLRRMPNMNTNGDKEIHKDVEIVHFFGGMCVGCNPHWKDRYVVGDICGVRVYTDRVWEPKKN